MNVFELMAVLKLNKDSYDKGLGDAEKSAERTGSKLGSTLGTIAKGTAAAIAAVGTAVAAGTKALVSETTAVSEYGDEVDKMSQKLGLSAQAYQEWDYVLKLSGTDMSSMSAGLKTLTNQIDAAKTGSSDAQAKFAALGISMEDLATMSREDVFKATINGFQGMADSTDRAALANDLFGKSGQNLAPLFNQTAAQTEEQIKLANEYGMVMGDDMVKNSARFQDALLTAQKTMTGLKNKMLGELLPGFSSVVEGFSDVVAGVEGGSEKIEKGISETITGLQKMMPKFLEVGKSIVLGLLNGVVSSLPDIMRTLLDIFGEVISAIGDILPQAVDSIMQIFPMLIQSLFDNLPKLVKSIVSMIPKIVSSLGQIIPQLIRGIAKAAPQIIDSVLSIVDDLILAICDALPEILISVVEEVPQMMDQIGDSVFRNFPVIIGAVLKGLANMTAEITGWFGHLFTTVDEEISALGSNISRKLEAHTSVGEYLKSMEPHIEDWKTLINSSGQTVDDLDRIITDDENHITEIMRTAFAEQGELRQQDIENINQYLEDMQKAYMQKIELATMGVVGQLQSLNNRLGTMNEEESAQEIANWMARMENAKAVIEEGYNSQLQYITNVHTQQGTLDSTAYSQSVAKLDSWKQQQLDLLNGYTTEATTILQNNAKDWESTSKYTWDNIGQSFSDFSTKNLSDFEKWAVGIAMKLGTWDNAKKQYLEALNSMEVKGAESMLSIAVSTKAMGGDVDESMKKTVNGILSAFDGKDELMGEQGKNILLGLINGMEDQIPELQNASEMSSEAIVDTIKKYLEIASPSKVMIGIGQFTIEGMIQGIQSGFQTLTALMRQMASAMYDGFTSIGNNMAQGLVNGFLSQESHIKEEVAGMMKRITKTAEDEMEVHSPSRVFEWIGQMLPAGLAEGIKGNAGEAIREMLAVTEDLSNIYPDTQGINFGSQQMFGAGQNIVGEEIVIPRGGEQEARQMTVILQLDRRELAKAVYQLNDEETQRVGLKLAGATT